MNKIIFICFLALAVSAETILNTTKNQQTLLYQITSPELLVVIGFEGQEEVRDYLFCRIPECECDDMVSKGQRSHPKPNSISTVSNLQCENSNTMTFERFDNGFKPYLWGKQNHESKEQQAPQRIAQEVTTTAAASTTTYTDTDMTASITVGTEFQMKWKFNDDATIDFCLCLNKKAWIGLGFGRDMKSVDMLTVNIVGSEAKVIDLWSTSDTTPLTDKQQDFTLISYSITDSAFKARIQRKLNTGDTSQDIVLTKGSTYTWSYASSTALVMEDHHNDYKVFSITLNSTGVQASNYSYLIGIMTLLLISLL